MIASAYRKFKHFLLVALLLIIPTISMAGLPFGGAFDEIDQTDQAANRLVNFWDLRMARQTYIQLTNTSNEKVNVHIQIFNVASPAVICEETNFDDMYTAGDTHVYDVSNLISNNDADGLGGVGFSAPNADLDEGYGLWVASLTEGPFAPLIGMFRIIDEDAGFEYRTNAAGEGVNPGNNIWSIADLNFNDVDGANLSDVVGMVYRDIDPRSVLASPQIQATFGDVTGDVTQDFPQIHIFDQFESPTSCSPTTFACDIGLLDKGIDNFHPNSKGENNRICNDSVDVGWLFMPLNRFSCFDEDPVGGVCQSPVFFVGFLGLNNGNGTGSMDSWWTPGECDEPGCN